MPVTSCPLCVGNLLDTIKHLLFIELLLYDAIGQLLSQTSSLWGDSYPIFSGILDVAEKRQYRPILLSVWVPSSIEKLISKIYAVLNGGCKAFKSTWNRNISRCFASFHL